MKSEDIYNAVTELRDDQIQAGEKKLRRARPPYFCRIGALAAVLALVILTSVAAGPWIGAQLRRSPEQTGVASTEATGKASLMKPEINFTNAEPTNAEPTNAEPTNAEPSKPLMADPDKFSLARANYPKMKPYPLDDPWHENKAVWDAWQESYNAIHSDADYSQGMSDYLHAAVPTLLSGTGTENRVVSPLNIYMALAMLAETTEGESREELLALLHVPDLETLRTQAKALWQANYCDDGRLTEVLANSLWLRDGTVYNDETVQRLAGDYYASVYSGPMGEEAYNDTLRAWMNEQTHGLLADQIRDVNMNTETVAALVSTLYYKASWVGGFSRMEEDQLFHSPGYDQKTPFMQRVLYEHTLYTGEGFQAAGAALDGGGEMYFLLPDEGVSPEQLLENANALNFLLSEQGRSSTDSRKVELLLTVPEFDVSAQLDLTGMLQEMGVSAIFDPERADFSPLMTDVEESITVSRAQHGARVAVDEDGVLGAAYTYYSWDAAEPEESERAELTLDRPFLLVVTNNEGLPIFVGIVNQP